MAIKCLLFVYAIMSCDRLCKTEFHCTIFQIQGTFCRRFPSTKHLIDLIGSFQLSGIRIISFPGNTAYLAVSAEVLIRYPLVDDIDPLNITFYILKGNTMETVYISALTVAPIIPLSIVISIGVDRFIPDPVISPTVMDVTLSL